MNQLVALRATGGDMSREDTWIQIFADHPFLAGTDAPAIALNAPRSVDEIVQDIERDLVDRAQVGTPALPDLLN